MAAGKRGRGFLSPQRCHCHSSDTFDYTTSACVIAAQNELRIYVFILRHLRRYILKKDDEESGGGKKHVWSLKERVPLQLHT